MLREGRGRAREQCCVGAVGGGDHRFAGCAEGGVRAVRAGAGKLRVKFVAGASNGKPTIGYTATCVSGNGGVKKSKKGSKSPLTVAGLTVGKRYRCTVFGKNARGPGRSSSASTPIIA